jgi:hypothetical protein
MRSHGHHPKRHEERSAGYTQRNPGIIVFGG